MRKLLIILAALAAVVAVGGIRYLYLIESFKITSSDVDSIDLSPVVDCTATRSFPGLSSAIDQIQKGKSGYFKKDQFSGGYAERDDFINRWYGKQLEAMEELSLVDRVSSDTEIYRFLWLRTFHHPIAVRIEKDTAAFRLVFVELSGAGGYDPGKILQRHIKNIDGSLWCEFHELLDQADFWELGVDEGDQALDGAKWIVEGVRDGRYHIVDRQSPATGRYREACIYLLRLSGIDTDRLGDELY